MSKRRSMLVKSFSGSLISPSQDLRDDVSWKSLYLFPKVLLVYGMKTYLEIRVPINYNDSWFEELRSHFAGMPVRWQKDFYHITMVFINDTPMDIDMCPLLERHLATAQAPVITFDQLDAFSIKSGRHIIHLSTSHVPEDFLALTESICADMKAIGCVILSDFMLHVTLGRVNSFDVELSEVKEIMGAVSFPSITLTLTDVDYRVFRGRTIYETQLKGKDKDICD